MGHYASEMDPDWVADVHPERDEDTDPEWRAEREGQSREQTLIQDVRDIPVSVFTTDDLLILHILMSPLHSEANVLTEQALEQIEKRISEYKRTRE